MSKLSVIVRNNKRIKLNQKLENKRKLYKENAKDLNNDDATRHEWQCKLQALPRNSAKVRIRNRCSITGRPRGVYRKFGLSRTKLREMAMNAEIPGIVKSSW